MRRLLTTLALGLTLFSANAVLAQTDANDPNDTSNDTIVSNIPVTGVLADGNGSCATFNGFFSIEKFIVRRGAIRAVGTLVGTITDASGADLGDIDKRISIPVTSIYSGNHKPRANCPVLHLTLGPVDLNLLGLKVHLDQIILNIDAESGPGNLLGNLLCQIAGILDRPNNPLGLVTRVLNQILGRLLDAGL